MEIDSVSQNPTLLWSKLLRGNEYGYVNKKICKFISKSLKSRSNSIQRSKNVMSDRNFLGGTAFDLHPRKTQ